MKRTKFKDWYRKTLLVDYIPTKTVIYNGTLEQSNKDSLRKTLETGDPTYLFNGMEFASSEQGFSYWYDRCSGLKGMSDYDYAYCRSLLEGNYISS